MIRGIPWYYLFNEFQSVITNIRSPATSPSVLSSKRSDDDDKLLPSLPPSILEVIDTEPGCFAIHEHRHKYWVSTIHKMWCLKMLPYSRDKHWCIYYVDWIYIKIICLFIWLVPLRYLWFVFCERYSSLYKIIYILIPLLLYCAIRKKIWLVPSDQYIYILRPWNSPVI